MKLFIISLFIIKIHNILIGCYSTHSPVPPNQFHSSLALCLSLASSCLDWKHYYMNIILYFYHNLLINLHSHLARFIASHPNTTSIDLLYIFPVIQLTPTSQCTKQFTGHSLWDGAWRLIHYRQSVHYVLENPEISNPAQPLLTSPQCTSMPIFVLQLVSIVTGLPIINFI